MFPCNEAVEGGGIQRDSGNKKNIFSIMKSYIFLDWIRNEISFQFFFLIHSFIEM